MTIRLTVGDQTAAASLNDTATARDFATLLPLTLDMHDLFGREKPGALPRSLTAGNGQSTYEVGDIGYWAPNHDIAIFYDHDGQHIPSPGIVIIGTVTSGIDVIADAGNSFQLTIETTD